MDLELIATVASPAVALAALVVAVLARLDSRQSSSAGKESAEASKRSATAAERAAMTGEAAVKASQRSATAAEDANEMLRRETEQREADRRDTAGPQFVPEETTVREDLTARVVMQVDGGPGDVRVVVRPAGVPWCSGISARNLGPDDVPGISVESLSMEPGDDVVVIAHLTVRPWHGHRRVILPLSVTASTRDGSEWWERRVAVPLLPPPGRPQMA